jgi:hypothetical protein
MSKMQVEFSHEATAIMERLATAESVSKIDILRRALAFYDYCKKETYGGGKILVEKDGVVTKELLMP